MKTQIPRYFILTNGLFYFFLVNLVIELLFKIAKGKQIKTFNKIIISTNSKNHPMLLGKFCAWEAVIHRFSTKLRYSKPINLG